MTDTTRCPMCGKKMSEYTKAETCSPKCRQRKSRLAKNAASNFMLARAAINDLIKTFQMDLITASESYEEVDELDNLMRQLARAHSDRWDRENTQGRDLTSQMSSNRINSIDDNE